MYGGGEVNDDVSSDDTEDEVFNCDSALEITFDDEFDEYCDDQDGNTKREIKVGRKQGRV